MLFAAALLAFGTLVSEDLTCISAGLLIQRGSIGPTAAIAACTIGIVAGDLGLWALGRVFGAVSLRWAWVGRHLSGQRGQELATWLDRHAGAAIVASRFAPGTRLPLYVMA